MKSSRRPRRRRRRWSQGSSVSSIRHRLAPLLPGNRIYFIPSFSFLIAARRPSKRYIPAGVVRRPEEGRIPCEGRPGRRESVDRLRDPRAALGGTRTCDRQPRRCRVVSLHESSEPVPERAVRSLERAPRGVLPRDDRDLPVPADAHHRGGDAPHPRPAPIPAMSGMRSAPRYPDRGGTRSPPPDRADAPAPREKGRLPGSPPQSPPRGALILACPASAFSTPPP